MSDDRKIRIGRRAVLQASLGSILSPLGAAEASTVPNTLFVRGMIASYLRDRAFVLRAV